MATETYHMIIVKGQDSQDAVTELQPNLDVVFSAGVNEDSDMAAIVAMHANVQTWLDQHADE